MVAIDFYDDYQCCKEITMKIDINSSVAGVNEQLNWTKWGAEKINRLMYKGEIIQGHLEKFDFKNGSKVTFCSSGNSEAICIKLHHGPSNVFETQLSIDP